MTDEPPPPYETVTLDAKSKDQPQITVPDSHQPVVRPPPSPKVHYRHNITVPSIIVKSEFSTIKRSSDHKQPLTCIVTIELPSRRTDGHGPGLVADPACHTCPILPPDNSSSSCDHLASRNTSDHLDITHQAHNHVSFSDSMASLPSNEAVISSNDRNRITEDLRNRIIDWKGHPLSALGQLLIFDVLSIRRDSLLREFNVYLFEKAVICVIEEKKSSLCKLFPSVAGSTSFCRTSSVVQKSDRVSLRLKGRIYICHIKRVTETSVPGELSITLDMEDNRLESFMLIFKDRRDLETWRTHIVELLASLHKPQHTITDNDEFDKPTGSKVQYMFNNGTGSGMKRQSEPLFARDSRRSTMIFSTPHRSGLSHGLDENPPHTEQQQQHNDDTQHKNTRNPVNPSMTRFLNNSFPGLPHTPLDVMLVISLPHPIVSQPSAALKHRIIKIALEFIISSLGPSDRLSLVTFEVGLGGRIRKTPFLCPGRMQGHLRLSTFVNGLGVENEDAEDEFVVRTAKDQKTDVLAAVNHGLDVVLQRTARNPISGMMLVSDVAESTRRTQIDLVLTRAEAAHIPIHSFGYGRSHDPAPLWLMSNHTNGSYTFVKDWYDLRDCLAGCLGGMMSIGLLNMKIHMKVLDRRRFRISKFSGDPPAIVASSGYDVDVDVGAFRYGERKEMLVELELDNIHFVTRNSTPGVSGSGRVRHRSHQNATERYVRSLGLNLHDGDDINLDDGLMEQMIDEVPVFEVNGMFFDPAARKHVSRLSHPVLLTITLLPTSSSAPPIIPSSTHVIVRRRIELLAAEMITRALVLVSRKNVPQAQKVLSEMQRILHTVLQNIKQSLPPPLPSSPSNTMRNRSLRETLALSAVRTLQSILADIQVFAEALQENSALLAHDQRNLGVQQAMVLRNQMSWSGRTPTEKLFWRADNSIELVNRSRNVDGFAPE